MGFDIYAITTSLEIIFILLISPLSQMYYVNGFAPLIYGLPSVLCLILELIGILKSNICLVIYSCIFRILYVMGNAYMCFLLVANNSGQHSFEISFGIGFYFVYVIVKTVMQFKFLDKIRKNDNNLGMQMHPPIIYQHMAQTVIDLPPTYESLYK